MFWSDCCPGEPTCSRVDSATLVQPPLGQEVCPSSKSSGGATSVPGKKARLGSACGSQWGFFFLANRKTIAYRSLLQAKDTKPSTPNKAAFNQVSLASQCLAWASLATASDAGLAFKV